MKNVRPRKEKKDIRFHHTGRLLFTCLVVFYLIACALPVFCIAADSVTEELEVSWRSINAVSQTLNYCSQNIYFYRQGGDSQVPIDVTYADPSRYNRYYGLLSNRVTAVPSSASGLASFSLNSDFWNNGNNTRCYFDYVTGDSYKGFNLTSSGYPLSSSLVSFVGTYQAVYPTWKEKIELNSDFPVINNYSSYDGYSYPSLVALRVFADVDAAHLTEYDYINFSYDYTTFLPSRSTYFNNQVNSLLSDSQRYAACVGYVHQGYFVPLVYADSQYTSFASLLNGNGVTTTQSIDVNIDTIVRAYNDRFSLNLTKDQFLDDFPTLTVAVTYWHVVYDFVDGGEPVASLQYLSRYNLPVVYLSNFNPVTVAISQVNQRLDQISGELFIVQDQGDVEIIDKLQSKIEGSSGLVSDYDSAAAALESIIGSVQPETNVIVNAFSTDPFDTGASSLFSNGFDLKGFMGSSYIMPILLIAVSVSVISWVIYGKRSG